MARQDGFTYVGLLFVVAFMGLLLASAGQVWHTAAQRDKEEELLFVGQQFRDAIASYRAATPGQPKHGPKRLEELLDDKRGTINLRHLRRIFVEPMTGTRDWGLIKNGDEIAGVYSQSDGKPYRSANFPPGFDTFAGAKTYRDWRFVPEDDSRN
jgi:type II secretory pathway pseudopilin PulG